jgi:hypothetical protein
MWLCIFIYFHLSFLDIREYAEVIGMDLNEPDDAQLLWVAREGLKAPLPVGWKPWYAFRVGGYFSCCFFCFVFIFNIVPKRPQPGQAEQRGVLLQLRVWRKHLGPPVRRDLPQ